MTPVSIKRLVILLKRKIDFFGKDGIKGQNIYKFNAE